MEWTVEQPWMEPCGNAERATGLVAVWCGKKPVLLRVPIGDRAVSFGREGEVAIVDRKLSRLHVEVARTRQRWQIRDLDSHNGTFVDGRALSGAVEVASLRVLRAGDTLFVPHGDLEALAGRPPDVAHGIVVGPTLRAAYRVIAAAGERVHIAGETGSGKELAARHYHAAGTGGPFVVVNCAALAPDLAESALFGVARARTGGAAGREGALVRADGGTLFLDELGELSHHVQDKLVRALQTREVSPLGATRPRALRLRLCTATHADPRALVASGRLRADLYALVAQPAVVLPPLRARLEDVPHLVATTLARRSRKLARKLTAHAGLVEQILLRPWPGNARELVADLADAGARATAARTSIVNAEHLAADAGMRFDAAGANRGA